ncbi:hypothetical protein [Longibacter sp.]|uniref:hypothetical protein n=1 Tax=Longibacter sp. TaxID=2045415 RepID=UPI003EBBFE0D
MSIRLQPVLRILATFVVALSLSILPASGQSGSDTGGSGSDVSGSDVAGALSQSSRLAQASFASDAVQQRVNAVAASLVQQLQSGSLLTASASMHVAPTTLAPALRNLLLEPNPEAEVMGAVSSELQAHGVSEAHASGLAAAVAGLLDGQTVEAPDLMTAVTAFNDLVDAAPASVLLDPPDVFVVVRDVLGSLLDATATP